MISQERKFVDLFVGLVVCTGVLRAEYASPCITPAGLDGKCMPIASCADIEAQLLELKSKHSQPSAVQLTFFRDSNCGIFDGVQHICCANAQIQQNSKTMALLRDLDCGGISGMRVAHGAEVKVSSRPWMALLKYTVDGVSKFLCGATLISKRYVLTAAHCVVGREVDLKQVRLGEHNIATESDCYFIRKNKKKCADPVEDVDIEKIILHSNYSYVDIPNDIALIKLKQDVEFKKHIKPICLPITPELKLQAEINENFLVAGWGTTANGSTSNVLREASVKNTLRESCSDTFNRKILDSQLCVGGDENRDSCKGDSGGPLQAAGKYIEEYRIRIVQFGIVSAGIRSCGSAGLPGIYTNVAYFMQWITDKMAS